MLNREDMLELTRRMTVSRCNIMRIAGAYMDPDGYEDGTFNTIFLKLSKAEQTKQLAVAKAIPFSDTNEQLKEYAFPGKGADAKQIQMLLEGLRGCELKNDALMMNLYEYFGERYHTNAPYGIFVYFGSYDIPVKGMDNEEQWESEEVYSYMVCAIAPLDSKGEISEPVCGFLYPSFKNRSCDTDHIAVYDSDGRYSEFLRSALAL